MSRTTRKSNSKAKPAPKAAATKPVPLNDEGEASGKKKLWIRATTESRKPHQSSVPLDTFEEVENWVGNNLLIHKRKTAKGSKGGRWECGFFKDQLGVEPEGIHPLADRVVLPCRFEVHSYHQMYSKPQQWDNTKTEDGVPKPPPKKNDGMLKPWTTSLPLDMTAADSEHPEDQVTWKIHDTMRKRFADYCLALPEEERLEIFGPMGSDLTEYHFDPSYQYWKSPISNWGDAKDRWSLRPKFDCNGFTKKPNYVVYDLSNKNRKMKTTPMIAPAVMQDGAGLKGTYVVNGFYVMQDWKKLEGSDELSYQGFYVGYTASWLVAFHLDMESMRANGFSKGVEGNDKVVDDFKSDAGLVQSTLKSMWEELDRMSASAKRKASTLEEAEDTGCSLPLSKKKDPPAKNKKPRTSAAATSGKGKEKETYDEEDLVDVGLVDDEAEEGEEMEED